MTIDNKDSTQSYDDHSKNVVSGVTSLSPSSTDPSPAPHPLRPRESVTTCDSESQNFNNMYV